MVLENTLERIKRRVFIPLGCKEINSENLLEELRLKLQYFGHLIQRVSSLEKTLMLGKIKGKRRRRQQRMRCLDSTINSMDMNLSKCQEIVEDRRD